MPAAINFRRKPPDLSFRYGTNEMRDELLAVECDYAKAVIADHMHSQIGLRNADAHLQETGLLGSDSMGKSRLTVLCNWLYITISCIFI